MDSTILEQIDRLGRHIDNINAKLEGLYGRLEKIETYMFATQQEANSKLLDDIAKRAGADDLLTPEDIHTEAINATAARLSHIRKELYTLCNDAENYAGKLRELAREDWK